MIELTDTRTLFTVDDRDPFVASLSAWLSKTARRTWMAHTYSTPRPLVRAELVALSCIPVLHNRLWRVVDAWNSVCTKSPGWGGMVQVLKPMFGSQLENLQGYVDDFLSSIEGVGNFVIDMHAKLIRDDLFGGKLEKAYKYMFPVANLILLPKLDKSHFVDMPGPMFFGNVDDDYRRVNRMEHKHGVSKKLPSTTIATRVPDADIDPELMAEIG